MILRTNSKRVFLNFVSDKKVERYPRYEKMRILGRGKCLSQRGKQCDKHQWNEGQCHLKTSVENLYLKNVALSAGNGNE